MNRSGIDSISRILGESYTKVRGWRQGRGQGDSQVSEGSIWVAGNDMHSDNNWRKRFGVV